MPTWIQVILGLVLGGATAVTALIIVMEVTSSDWFLLKQLEREKRQKWISTKQFIESLPEKKRRKK